MKDKKKYFLGSLIFKGVQRHTIVIASTQKQAREFIKSATGHTASSNNMRSHWFTHEALTFSCHDGVDESTTPGVYCSKDMNHPVKYERVWKPKE